MSGTAEAPRHRKTESIESERQRDREIKSERQRGRDRERDGDRETDTERQTQRDIARHSETQRARVWCYAVNGTELGYGATHRAMVLCDERY
eukprot:3536976-Rhodomonas_salina.2